MKTYICCAALTLSLLVAGAALLNAREIMAEIDHEIGDSGSGAYTGNPPVNQQVKTGGKRVAPVYRNEDGTTTTIIDGVEIIQDPSTGEIFTQAQLDQIASILDATSPEVRKNITKIIAAKMDDKKGAAVKDDGHDICINISNMDANGSATNGKTRDLEQLLTHEIGHIVYDLLPQNVKDGFDKLYANSKTENDFARTDYKGTYDKYEDFADTYMELKTNPGAINNPNNSATLQAKYDLVWALCFPKTPVPAPLN